MKGRAVILLLVAVFSGACASAGTRAIGEPETLAKIEVGKSTRADVTRTLGPPAQVNFVSGGEEIWSYVHMRMQTRAATFIPVVGFFAGGADVNSQTLTILFDKSGVVKNMGRGELSGGGGSVRD